MFPHGWVVYGVPTERGVRLVASRAARGQVEHGGRGSAPKVNLSVGMDGVEIIEAACWRDALEELYRRWTPTPEGDVHHT
jgi:hypothetical protein